MSAFHSSHGMMRSICVRNSFFFVRTFANSSLNADSVICLFILPFYHIVSSTALRFFCAVLPYIKCRFCQPAHCLIIRHMNPLIANEELIVGVDHGVLVWGEIIVIQSPVLIIFPGVTKIVVQCSSPHNDWSLLSAACTGDFIPTADDKQQFIIHHL